MNEKMMELIQGLGNDGLTAFYVYLAVDTLQPLAVVVTFLLTVKKIFFSMKY